MNQFLFAFASISAKSAFKDTCVKKVHFGEHFNAKCALKSKLIQQKIICLLVLVFETNFLVLQAKLVKIF